MERGGSSSSSSGVREDNLVLHVKSCAHGHKPMQMNSQVPVEYESDNFKGTCLFMHRPNWSYDNVDTAESYPYKRHFHGRKRLWEYRIQGKFKRRPGMLYCGVELEDFVPVNFATRTLMRGMMPLIQGALQCKAIRHEIGKAEDKSLRPTVVAPIWAADNTHVHEDPAAVPDIAQMTVPDGLSRKAARQFWEELWEGGGPSWDASGGPTFTFCIWGPSQLLDLRAWVFRKLPLMWGRSMSLEPFAGKQPVHGVIYELEGNSKDAEHRQGQKVYSLDIRMMPESIWSSYAFGDSGVHSALSSAAIRRSISSESFCSAVSQTESPEQNGTEEKLLLPASGNGDIDDSEDDFLRSPTSQLPVPLVRSGSNGDSAAAEQRALTSFLRCCRRRRRGNFIFV
ncbi:unnamed protein product [Polarella glacialis]|uniref:Domain of unknown function at the cortex 1 domain-containing protein n=1 Tax=Polarella glacialis TaxID=89957 RepID=A0A813L1N8_POLGL|nr:unnamed protein product [Polarella glacialis]